MASGGGLKKRKINYDSYNVSDIIACVRNEDFFMFFSFSELYRDKGFNDTKFLFKKKSLVSFGKDLSRVMNKNKYLGITNMLTHKVINRKKSLYEIFHFKDYGETVIKEKIRDKGNNRESIEGVFRYLNGIENATNIVGGVKQNLKKTNFLTETNITLANNESINQNIFFMRVLDNDFIVPNDLESFAINFIRLSKAKFKGIDLKSSSLPRIADLGLLNYVLVQEMSKEMSSGDLCYTIVNYDKSQIALISNAEINEENMITKINEKTASSGFVNFSKGCLPNNFKVNDQVVGIFDRGSYNLNDRKKLLEIESEERDYFQNYVDNYDSGEFKKKSIAGFRKFFRYPKTVLTILVLRDSITTPTGDTRTTSKTYTQAFYNLVSLYKPVKKDGQGKVSALNILSGSNRTNLLSFRTTVIKELISFIKNNYLRNLKVTAKKDSSKKKLLEYIKRINNEIEGRRGFFEKSFSYKGPISERGDFVFVITNLVGIKDQNQALVEFLSNPVILYGNADGSEYPNLRLISYFIQCEKVEQCDDIKETGNGNLSFPFLLASQQPGTGDSYSMYYNKNTEMFTNIPL
tara:strand:- start:532 stop:2262 length:1731 start_codon:yes stop_codon:yes gene_type:complete